MTTFFSRIQDKWEDFTEFFGDLMQASFLFSLLVLLVGTVIVACLITVFVKVFFFKFLFWLNSSA